LVAEGDSAPAYLSDGGSYGFADGQLGPGQSQMSEPVRVKLRTRCAVCHGVDLAQIRTFSVARPPNPPPIKLLNPAATEAADFDISQKRKEKDFQALFGYFQ
jgi:hypothetical protein